jgi:hypothetical protein
MSNMLSILEGRPDKLNKWRTVWEKASETNTMEDTRLIISMVGVFHLSGSTQFVRSQPCKPNTPQWSDQSFSPLKPSPPVVDAVTLKQASQDGENQVQDSIWPMNAIFHPYALPVRQ